MKIHSRIAFSIVLTFVFAGISLICGGNCADGFCSVSGVYAAQVNRGPIAPKRDPQLEKEAAHNLDVAWQYFKRNSDKDGAEAVKRRNKQILGRLTEILDVNPDFAKVDEVYFLFGEVYLRDDNQEEALKYFSQVAEKYPDSKYNKDAKKRLSELQTSAGKKSEDKQEGKKKS